MRTTLRINFLEQEATKELGQTQTDTRVLVLFQPKTHSDSRNRRQTDSNNNQKLNFNQNTSQRIYFVKTKEKTNRDTTAQFNEYKYSEDGHSNDHYISSSTCHRFVGLVVSTHFNSVNPNETKDRFKQYFTKKRESILFSTHRSHI